MGPPNVRAWTVIRRLRGIIVACAVFGAVYTLNDLRLSDRRPAVHHKVLNGHGFGMDHNEDQPFTRVSAELDNVDRSARQADARQEKLIALFRKNSEHTLSVLSARFSSTASTRQAQSSHRTVTPQQEELIQRFRRYTQESLDAFSRAKKERDRILD